MLTFLLVWAFSAIPKEAFQGYDFISKKEATYHLVSKNEYTIVYFFNVDCPCSGAHFSYLNDLQKIYPQWSFIGFHSNKSVERSKAQDYFSNFPVPFPIYEDKNLTVANQFKAIKTPHVYVLDSQGNIVYQGGATDAKDPLRAKKHYLKEVLAALKENHKPPYQLQKTLGCYIER